MNKIGDEINTWLSFDASHVLKSAFHFTSIPPPTVAFCDNWTEKIVYENLPVILLKVSSCVDRLKFPLNIHHHNRLGDWTLLDKSLFQTLLGHSVLNLLNSKFTYLTTLRKLLVNLTTFLDLPASDFRPMRPASNHSSLENLKIVTCVGFSNHLFISASIT